jgi:type IV pilus assembly protein PilA
MPSHARRTGFTLIELLIVVVVIGILASIAMPSFKGTKGKSYTAAMKSDLRNLATAQESYFYDHNTYASDLSALPVSNTPNVNLTIVEGSLNGWAATATHAGLTSGSCAVYYGTAAAPSPATSEAKIACN